MRSLLYDTQALNCVNRGDMDVSYEQYRIDEMHRYGALIHRGRPPSSSSSSSSSSGDDMLVLHRIGKHYHLNFMAVKGLSVGLRRGECFGLLGVNGAGKTTTFRMLTGDTVVTRGNAYLNGVSLRCSPADFQHQLGYCPQVDALIDRLTVYEHMWLYANLRCLRRELVHRTCVSLIALLDLDEHANKRCYTLSGGNKRKLCVAIALVGSPNVVLLDEPTS